MIRSSNIESKMKEIWGCNFYYDNNGKISFPKTVVSFTEKTRFVFNINKGFIGERYRKKLIKLIDRLDLYEHVKFHNRFLHKRELIKYLQATDIYITPYPEPNQISSGTLVYAMGTGKAIIATPYLHAREALAKGRGLFCKFRNHKSIAKGISKLLKDEKLRRNMQRKVYSYSRDFTWIEVKEIC